STCWNHHHGEEGHRRDSRASTPQARPARPTASPRDARTGTNSSQIHAVPHSETQRLVRYRNATKATGRVSKPISSRSPSGILAIAWRGAARAGGRAASAITAFQVAGA